MRTNVRLLSAMVLISSLATGCWEQFQGPATGPNGAAELVKPYAGVRLSSSTGLAEAHQSQADAFLSWSHLDDPMNITMAGLDQNSGVRSVNGYIHLTGECDPTAMGQANFEVRQLIIRTFNGASSAPRRVEATSISLDTPDILPLLQQCPGTVIEIEGDVQVAVKDWKGNAENAFVGTFLYVH